MTDFADDVIQMMDAAGYSVRRCRRPLDGEFRRTGAGRACAARESPVSCCSASAPRAMNDVVTVLQSAVECTDRSDRRGVRARVSVQHGRATGARAVHGRGDRQQPAHARGDLEEGARPACWSFNRGCRARACVRWCSAAHVTRSSAPASSSRWRGSIPVAQLRLIDDVGHALHWEQPDVFVRELYGLPGNPAIVLRSRESPRSCRRPRGPVRRRLYKSRQTVISSADTVACSAAAVMSAVLFRPSSTEPCFE